MKYTWLVEKYLEGELSGEALRKFELEILTKAEVAEEVERIRSLDSFMKKQHHRMKSSVGLIEDFDDIENVVSESTISRELEELKIRKISSSRDEIVDFETSLAESRAQQTLSKYRSNKIVVRKITLRIAAAASLAIFMTVSALLLTTNSDADFAGLYNQYYSPYPADVLRTAPDNAQEPYQQALKAYSEGDYNKAILLFNSIPLEGVSNSFYLYKGITAMELGKYPLAIELFNKLDKDVILKHEGMWYESLCYLGMEDEKATRSALNEIIQVDGYYKNRAATLLRKI